MRSILGEQETHEIGVVTSFKEKNFLHALDRVGADVNLLEKLLLRRDH